MPSALGVWKVFVPLHIRRLAGGSSRTPPLPGLARASPLSKQTRAGQLPGVQ